MASTSPGPLAGVRVLELAQIMAGPSCGALLAEHLRARPTRDWLRDLDAAGIPAGPIQSIAEMAADPQTLARAIGRIDP